MRVAITYKHTCSRDGFPCRFNEHEFTRYYEADKDSTICEPRITCAILGNELEIIKREIV